MKKSILENICNYLHNFENTTLINKEIIALSKKIENFCFKCNKESSFLTLNNISNNKLNNKNSPFNASSIKVFSNNTINERDDTYYEDIDFNPSAYLEHDILNKYLYLSEYLENCSDKKEGVHYLHELIITKNLTNSNIVNNSSLDSGLLSNILNNKSKITKDMAIKLCFGLNLNYQESMDFLLRFGYTLNTLNKRDCLIRYGLEHNLAVDEVDYILEELNENSLIN